MQESGIYTATDLKPYQSRLAELKQIIVDSHSQDDEEATDEVTAEEGLTKLLLAKWNACGTSFRCAHSSSNSSLLNLPAHADRLLTKLVSSLSQLSPELAPLHQRLITLRRLLASIAARPRPTANDVTTILTELRSIDDKRVSGKFVIRLGPGATEDDPDEEFAPEKGQELLAGLLEDNFEICQEIQAREGAEDVARGPLQPIYDRLSELRAQLERLVLTHRWTLRETVSFFRAERAKRI